VLSLAGKPGDRIAVGAELAVFETGDSAAAQSGTDTSTSALHVDPSQNVRPDSDRQNQKPADDKPQTSPAVRRRAREQGVDLGKIPGTGPDGRISNEDLDRFLDLKNEGVPPETGGPQKGTSAVPPGVPQTATQQIPVIGLRRRIAEKMAAAKRHIPHFGYVEEVDVTELDALRNHRNANRGPEQAKLSYLPFVMRALVRVLSDFPQCNAHFDDEKNIITRYAGVHIGIATQTGSGLMVPVVKHAEALDLWQCAADMLRVTEAARSGKATIQELRGSTITLTSLGALGGIVTTPIINYPEVAIIGINKVQQRPVYQNEIVVPRLLMNLSSSFDHRVVDGYDAARMIQALKDLLEHPAIIFL
ncbi:MAG: dihydrolipoamide acetyltransferase family protein, partial [Gammaproteobacteria bacterium]